MSYKLNVHQYMHMYTQLMCFEIFKTSENIKEFVVVIQHTNLLYSNICCINVLLSVHQIVKVFNKLNTLISFKV